MRVIKKILPWTVFILFAALIIAGLSLKGKMNDYLSKEMRQQVSPELKRAGNALVDSLYNYQANGMNYEITFLEFGSKGCSACRKMEKVMEDVRTNYPGRVNVVFMNVLKPEAQHLMKLFGIVSIPTQVLLNSEGKEFFRHSGFIEARELTSQFNVEFN